MQDSAQRHHIKPKQHRIFLSRKVVPDFISAELPGSSLVSVVPLLHAEEWTPHSPELNTLQIRFETSCKNLCMKGDVNQEHSTCCYMLLHELEKATRQKWNETTKL